MTLPLLNMAGIAERALRDRGRLRSFFSKVCETRLRQKYLALQRGEWTPPRVKTHADITVSLTSWGPKLLGLPLSLITLLEQRVRPARIVLWLTGTDRAGLESCFEERFSAFGVQVRICDDLGCHKKWLPMIESGQRAPFVICDDDILYPKDWLEQLLREDRHDAYVGLRCHRVAVSPSGDFSPYATWRKQISWQGSPSSRLFLTGGAGAVIHPERIAPPFLDRAAIAVHCPTADDIWLYAAHHYAGVPVYKTRYSFPCLELPGSADHGLAHSNVDGGMNDRQLADTWKYLKAL